MSKFHWNSGTIKTELERYGQVSSVTINSPGGDVDTEKLVVSVINGGDALHVCGFSTDDDFWKKPDKGDIYVDFIELTDGMDSRGGLNSNSTNTALAYVAIREYFQNRGADVVPSMDEYF